jgi:hypothetical protein
MTKYRALADIAPHITRGDIVNFQEELVDGYKKLFEQVGDSEVIEGESEGLIGNPDRNALKARATELGINFAPNMPTDRLVELVKEAEEKAKTNEGSGQ